MQIKIENKLNFNENYPIFLSENFLKTESNEYGWIIGYLDDEVEVILPFIIYKKIIFRLLRFTNAPYFLHQDMKKKYEQYFIDNIIHKTKELNVDLIMQPTTNVVFDKVPKSSIYAPFGTYKIDLTLDENILWKNLHAKHRNVIRNAEKKGINIIENNYNINEIYTLISNTFKRSSMDFMTKEKFEKQIENFGKNVKVFIARTENGEMQGCAIIPFSNYGGYYLHGGSIKKPLTGAMNYMQWKIILSLKNSAVCEYDFVGARVDVDKGTKLEGIQKFKERFGSTLYKGYMWKYPIRPFKAKLFDFFYKILKKSEGDIIDQEKARLK